MAGAVADKKGNRSALLLVLILLAGLAVRIAYLVQLRSTVFSELLPLDARFYRDLATGVSSGGWFPRGGLTFNPLYPAFLALIFRLFGESLNAVRISQFFLGLVNIGLLFVAGRRLGGRNGKGVVSGETVGLFAAAMALMYPHFILYEGSLLATSVVTFLATASFTLILVIDQDLQGERSRALFSQRIPRGVLSLFLGMLLGAGALGRPNLFLILVPAVSLWLFLRHRTKKGCTRSVVLLLVGAFLFLLPPILYNASQTGRFIPVTAHGGINFYAGNQPGADGTYRSPRGMRGDMRGLIEDAKAFAERETGRSLTQAEVSDYWFGMAMEGILADPGVWIRLMWRKLLLFWNGVEVADVLDISFYRDACPVLKLLLLPFAVISSLSLLGLGILITSKRNRSIMLLFVLTSLASVLPFYVNSRYRIPVIPVLILSGALFLAWIVEEVRGRRWKPVLVTGVICSVLLVATARPLVKVNRSAGYTFLGNYYVEKKDEAKAEEAFAEAFRLAPDLVETKINYAKILQKRGKLERAEELYDAAFMMQPDFPLLAIEYGSILEQRGRSDDAKRLYTYAFSLHRARDRVIACKLLSRLAFAEGKRDEAVMWIRKALEIVPGDKSLGELLHKLEGEP